MLRDGKFRAAFSHSDFTLKLGIGRLPTQAIQRAVFDIRVEDV